MAEYLFVYNYEYDDVNGHGTGHGSCIFELGHGHDRVTGKDIMDLCSKLKAKHGFAKVAISGFFPLADEEDEDEQN